MSSQLSAKANLQRRICAGRPPRGREMGRDEGSFRSSRGTARTSAGDQGCSRLGLNWHSTLLKTRTPWV